MSILKIFLISLIKFYKLVLSPLLVTNCRYLPTCSDNAIHSIHCNAIQCNVMLFNAMLSNGSPKKYASMPSCLFEIPKSSPLYLYLYLYLPNTMPRHVEQSLRSKICWFLPLFTCKPKYNIDRYWSLTKI